MKQDLLKIMHRLEALWHNELIDRCCVSLTAPKDDSCYIEKPVPDNEKDLISYYTDAEWIMQRNLDRIDNTWYGGDALPIIFPFFGTGGHAKYLGIPYQYKPDTVWYSPLERNLSMTSLHFDPYNEAFLKEKEILRYLADNANGRYFVGMPDNCGSLDALAEMRGNSRLLLDMLDDPQMVKFSRDKIVEVLKYSGDVLFGILRENNQGGSTHGWMNTWSPGRHMQMQCDLSVMISPDMFEEFVLAELEETSRWLDHSIYHLDGMEQIRHLDMILSVEKLNMIQWTQVEGQPPATEFIPILQKIQRAGKGLVLICKPHQVKPLISQLSPKGLLLVVERMNTKEEANDLLEFVERETARNKDNH